MMSTHPKEARMPLVAVPGIVKPVPSLGPTATAVLDEFFRLDREGYRPLIDLCDDHGGTFFLTRDGWARQRDGGWTYEPVPRRHQHHCDHRIFEAIRNGYATIRAQVGSAKMEVHRAIGRPIPAE